MTAISAENLVKIYPRPIFSKVGPVRAIDGISFNVQSGKRFAILGPSGCGKSTLLRILAGLSKPDRGCVRYDGLPLSEIRIEDRGIGIIFQSGGFHPQWKTRRSVGFFLELRKRSDELPERLEEISRITGLGIEQLLERRPSELSHGEIQRVAVARALARDLKVLLLDEPFANIDAKLRQEARLELKRLLNAFPTTTVYFTHQQEEARAFADRIAVMREGKFEQIARYKQLHDAPKNSFIATFIGTPTMNMFSGKVENGKWEGMEFGGYPIRTDLSEGTEVMLGVRPEAVRLDESGFEGRVVQSIHLYSDRIQELTLKIGAEEINLFAPMDLVLKPGDVVRCSLDPEGILFFDPVTELRIG